MMKTKLYILIGLFFFSMNVNAQLDRSKQPEPGPAPKIQLETPEEFQLPNGLTVMVVENHKLPRVSYNLTIDNTPRIEGKKAGVSSLLSGMMGNGTSTISKDDFNEEIDFLGANLNFGSNRGFASGLSKYSERILELMADAAINPLFTEEEFKKQLDIQVEGLKSNEKSVDAVAGRVGPALTYGVKHPYGEFITEESLKSISLDDVRVLHEKNFNPANAYLVVIGDVDPVAIERQVTKYFGDWKTAATMEREIPKANPNVQYTQIAFIDMPNAVQSNISVTHSTNLKMSDPDYHSLLIANKILGGGFNSYLNMNLREEHGYTYGARSGLNANKYISRFRAGAAVRNMVTDSAVVETLKEINRIRTEPVSEEALKNAKAKYTGDFVLALERPQTIAQYALDIKINDLPKDFYRTYLEKINAVTKEDVMRVAQKYFTPKNARIVVVGKGSEVLENLEKTKIPIKYYDKYANEVAKPQFSKPIPEGVTAQSVIDKYITAIGGKEKAMAVKSVHSSANVTIEGVPMSLSAEMKQMAPNMSSMEMSAEGMGVLIKQKFNGENGYVEQQGMKQPLSEEQIAEKKGDYTIFPELYYRADQLTLNALTTIDGNDVYKLKVTVGDNSSFRYYNADTGLLVRTESESTAQGQTVTSVANYSNYSNVGEVQFPYYMSIKSGPQVITMNFTNVKVNEGVSEADFE